MVKLVTIMVSRNQATKLNTFANSVRIMNVSELGYLLLKEILYEVKCYVA
jgi:hypothetical protein